MSVDGQNVTSEEEMQSDYIDSLIDSIIQCYHEDDLIDPKRVYKTLVKRCRRIYAESQIRETDDLWQKLSTKAEEFVAKNEEIEVSDEAGFEHALKKFKVLIMDKINDRLDPNEEDDGFVMTTEETDEEE